MSNWHEYCTLDSMNKQSKFKNGQAVISWNQETRSLAPGRVQQPAPYPAGKCDGAYITWDTVQPYGSRSGWQPENQIHITTPHPNER